MWEYHVENITCILFLPIALLMPVKHRPKLLRNLMILWHYLHIINIGRFPYWKLERWGIADVSNRKIYWIKE